MPPHDFSFRYPSFSWQICLEPNVFEAPFVLRTVKEWGIDYKDEKRSSQSKFGTSQATVSQTDKDESCSSETIGEINAQ